MTFEFRADLHCHTSFSDGTDTPDGLIEYALQKGLQGISITDHDTIAAYTDEVRKQSKILLLNGIEFSASYKDEPVHILGYAYQFNNAAILELCARHKKRREERNQKILKKLSTLGIQIQPEELTFKASWGRPHIAQILFQRGIVRSIQAAFDAYLAEGKPAYVPAESYSVEETIEIIHHGKGKAIIAHPHLLKRRSTLRALLKFPFDGMECYYARFTKEQDHQFLEIAKQKKWLVTGGSDYHGSLKPFSLIGASWVGKETFDLLYDHFLQVNGK